MKLNELEKDILMEIGNIGAGRAASSLAKFLHQEVSMSLPFLEELSTAEEFFAKIKNNFDLTDEEYAMVHTTIDPTKDYMLFCLIPKESCMELAKLSFEVNPKPEIWDSLILEIGNILMITYIDALNKFISIDLMPEPGVLQVGAVSDLITHYQQRLNQFETEDSSPDESYFLVDLSIFAVSQKISVYLGLIPTARTVSKISKQFFEG